MPLLRFSLQWPGSRPQSVMHSNILGRLNWILELKKLDIQPVVRARNEDIAALCIHPPSRALGEGSTKDANYLQSTPEAGILSHPLPQHVVIPIAAVPPVLPLCTQATALAQKEPDTLRPPSPKTSHCWRSTWTVCLWLGGCGLKNNEKGKQEKSWKEPFPFCSTLFCGWFDRNPLGLVPAGEDCGWNCQGLSAWKSNLLTGCLHNFKSEIDPLGRPLNQVW